MKFIKKYKQNIMIVVIVIFCTWNPFFLSSKATTDDDRQTCELQNQIRVNQYALETLFLGLAKEQLVGGGPDREESENFLNQFGALHEATFEGTREAATNPDLPKSNPESVRVECSQLYPYPWPLNKISNE